MKDARKIFDAVAAWSICWSSSSGIAKLITTWLSALRMVLAGAVGAGLVAVASGAPLINPSAFLVARLSFGGFHTSFHICLCSLVVKQSVSHTVP